MTNKAKFKSRLDLLGYNVEKLGFAIGVPTTTMYRKVNNDEFNQKELLAMKKVLKLNRKDFDEIFFATELSKIDN